MLESLFQGVHNTKRRDGQDEVNDNTEMSYNVACKNHNQVQYL